MTTKKKTMAPKAKPKAKKPAAPKYVSVINVLYHPFQKVYIPTGHPGVMLEEDSWLDCQLERNLVKKIS